MRPNKPGKIDVTPCSLAFRDEIKTEIEENLAAGARRRPRLVGFLANKDDAATMYARWTERACKRDGIEYELRRVEPVELEDAIVAANTDPNVDGIIVYYPVFGGPIDDYLRDVISLEKDVEGLNHRYRYSMYHNIRTLADRGHRKAILPCTPLAILKILNFLGAYDLDRPLGEQLAGQVVVLFNRSEVVGRPLAAMLANDGAFVYSVDIANMLVYRKGRIDGTIKVEETTMTQDEALALAAIVIAGVPSPAFSINPTRLKRGCIAINFSQYSNFGEGTEDVATYVPAIGKVTIAMLERNVHRLHLASAAASRKAAVLAGRSAKSATRRPRSARRRRPSRQAAETSVRTPHGRRGEFATDPPAANARRCPAHFLLRPATPRRPPPTPRGARRRSWRSPRRALLLSSRCSRADAACGVPALALRGSAIRAEAVLPRRPPGRRMESAGAPAQRWPAARRSARQQRQRAARHVQLPRRRLQRSAACAALFKRCGACAERRQTEL